MKKTQLLLSVALFSVLMAGAGGGVAWWLLNGRTASAAQMPAPDEVEFDKREYKYLSLDKVIVMLRGSAGQPLSHYLAMDLVFKTPVEKEKVAKQHLPLLRSIAVKALSAYTFDQAAQMTVDEFAADINRAYEEGYAKDRTDKPFVEAMIGKLIIE